MSILGLDLSLTATGICDDNGPQVLSSRRRGMQRLDDLLRLVRTFTDDAGLVVLEGYSFGSRGAAVVSLGELGGVIRHHMWNTQTCYAEVPPSVVKKFATGKGNAGKPDMLAAAIRAGYEGPNEDNCVDAWWLRQLGLYEGGASDVAANAYRDEAITKVEWPAA